MYRAVGALVEVDAQAIARPVVDMAIPQIKARMPELVDSAMQAAVAAVPRYAPAMLSAATPALRTWLAANASPLITSAAPAMESYLTNRLYPKVLKPLAERELSAAREQAGTTAQKAALVSGGVVLALGAAAALVWVKRKEIFS